MLSSSRTRVGAASRGAHIRAGSTAPAASRRVAASSDRLAANCAADRRSELLASWRARPRHCGQHRAAAAVLRAARELSTAGSAHTVRCSTRTPAGSGSTRRRAACTLLHLRVDGTIQRCAAARGSAADGEFVCRGFDVGLVGRPRSMDPDRLGSLECDGEPCCTSACGLSHGGRASAGSLMRSGAAAGSVRDAAHAGCSSTGTACAAGAHGCGSWAPAWV